MIIKVKVKTNSDVQSVEKISPELFSEEGYEGFYFVKLKSFPEKGEANLELLKLLKKHFGREVKIKSGFTSRMKVIEVGVN
jgi:uncharacterized protein (TIGR00251 family)